MIKNENTRIWVNRILAFLFGALLLFLIMNFSVVKNFKNQNAGLKSELSAVRSNHLNDPQSE